MKSIRETFPIIIGWLAYQAYYRALGSILLLCISYFFVRYSLSKSPLLWSLILIGINAFVSYITFLASVHWLASPIFMRIKNVTQKSNRNFLIVEWIIFSVFVFICNLPLAYTGIFPVSKTMHEIIAFVWKTIVSALVYRSIVSNYVFESAKTVASKNEQQTTFA